MSRPVWLAYGFAVLMVSVSVYCAGRLALSRRLRRRIHYDVNIAHVLMGTAMVGMLVPRWNVLPDGLWEVVFAVMALYFLVMAGRFGRLTVLGGPRGADRLRLHQVSHYLIHMVMGCAMLYMYWLGMPITAQSIAGMSGPPAGAGDPSLTLFIVAVLLTSAVWQLNAIDVPERQLILTGGGGTKAGTLVQTAVGGDERPWLAPRLEICCHVAMCFTMGYMLILMV